MSTVRGLPAGVLGRGPLLRWRGAPDLPAWAWYGVLAVLAVGMGVGAGINPKYAIAAAFGLAFVMLVLVDLTFGLCAFTFLSFLELLLVTEDRSFSFLKVAGFLLMLSWVAKISTSRDQDKSFIAAHPQFTFVLIAFFSWALLSSYWAESPGRTYDSSWRYLQNMILFLIVYTAIRERKHIKWLGWSWLGGATCATIPAILNPPQAEADLTTRISGTIGDPNELAALLIAGTAFAGILAVTTKEAALRVAAGSAVVLFLAGIIYTVSRGGLLALLVALIAACLLAGRWRDARLS